jgi:hypothetical protein
MKTSSHQAYYWLLAVLSFILVPSAHAQLQFTPHILHDFGEVETQGKIRVADFNQDSLPDVFASGANPNVVWFKNLGGQSFDTMVQVFDAEIFGESLDVVDFDEDGDPDLVVALSFSSVVVRIENLGNGQFGEGVEIYQSDYPMDDLVTADLDGDNRKDILFATWDIIDKIGEVRWMRNQGGGQFGAPQLITNQAHEVRHLAVGLINNDPHLDVVVASYWDFRLDWYANSGNGTFSGAQSIRDQQDSIRSHASVVADIDSDGDQDVLQFCQASPYLAWYENDGDGMFSPPMVISADHTGWDGVVADFDRDGDEDIITGISQSDALVFFENDGNENFAAPLTLATDLEIPNDLHAADLDGDQDMDVLIASTLEGKYMWFENRGVTVFTQDVNSIASLLVSPNPASDEIRIQVPENNAGVISLYTMAGVRVTSAGIHTAQDVCVIDISNLPTGMYMVVWKDSKGGMQAGKVVKR